MRERERELEEESLFHPCQCLDVEKRREMTLFTNQHPTSMCDVL